MPNLIVRDSFYRSDINVIGFSPTNDIVKIRHSNGTEECLPRISIITPEYVPDIKKYYYSAEDLNSILVYVAENIYRGRLNEEFTRAATDQELQGTLKKIHLEGTGGLTMADKIRYARYGINEYAPYLLYLINILRVVKFSYDEYDIPRKIALERLEEYYAELKNKDELLSIDDQIKKFKECIIESIKEYDCKIVNNIISSITTFIAIGYKKLSSMYEGEAGNKVMFNFITYVNKISISIFVHELAHSFKIINTEHSPVFCKNHLELVKICLGEEAANILQEEYERNGDLAATIFAEQFPNCPQGYLLCEGPQIAENKNTSDPTGP